MVRRPPKTTLHAPPCPYTTLFRPLLPAGGARNARDAALWDLEARQRGMRVWQRAGVNRGGAVTSAVTIGMRAIGEYERSARLLADHAWIKIKVDRKDPVAAVAAVRSAAPRPRLIVAANQSWQLAGLGRKRLG